MKIMSLLIMILNSCKKDFIPLLLILSSLYYYSRSIVILLFVKIIENFFRRGLIFSAYENK